MREVVLTKELLQQEATGILKTVRDNATAGRSNKLGEVKQGLESSVTIDFDDYFLFLRKFNFMVLDREAGALSLTPEGDRILSGAGAAQMEFAIEHFFATRLGDEVIREDSATDPGKKPPPPVAPESESPRRAAPPSPPPSIQVNLGGAAAPIRLEEPAAPPRRSERVERPEPRTAVEAAKPAADAPRAAAGDARPKVEEPERGRASVGPVERGAELDLRYVKYESLGGGAMATVFRGKQTGLGIDVAIKELRDIFAYFSFLQRGEVVKRLKKELCAQAQLRHPGVVSVLDQNCEVARPYYVLELCAGGSLRQRLDAAPGKPLPVGEALRLFLQMTYALRAAHKAGLLHQNLKPENVLFDSLGNARLADFGLSRVIETEAQQKQLPQVFLGTGGMGYLPPEQLSGKKDFGPEGDVYMLGLILYEMLAGTLPGRRSPLPSGANSAVPAKIDPIFDRMTQDRRESRYPTVDALLDDFYAAFADGRYLRKGDLLLFSEPPVESAAEGEKHDKAEAAPKERRGGASQAQK